MDFPEEITPFTLALPWETTINGSPVTEVVFDFDRANLRFYGAMAVAEYQNNGASASPTFDVGFTIAANQYSFSFDPDQFGKDLVQVMTEAIARHFVQADVVASKPAEMEQVPTGVQWPLSDQVVDYIDNGGSILPVPRGIYSAFRFYPDTEYGSVSDDLGRFRGDAPVV